MEQGERIATMSISLGGRQVFVSYSHKDKPLVERLAAHLRVLQSYGHARIFCDLDIEGGQRWRLEIGRAIDASSLALVLVSTNLLTSSFVTGQEIPRILEREAESGLRMIPVLLLPCPWELCPWLEERQIHMAGGRALGVGTEEEIERNFAALALKVLDWLYEEPEPDPPAAAAVDPKATERSTDAIRDAKVLTAGHRFQKKGLAYWLARHELLRVIAPRHTFELVTGAPAVRRHTDSVNVFAIIKELQHPAEAAVQPWQPASAAADRQAWWRQLRRGWQEVSLGDVNIQEGAGVLAEACKFLVVGSVAGGTGAGMLLDAGLLARHIRIRHRRASGRRTALVFLDACYDGVGRNIQGNDPKLGTVDRRLSDTHTLLLHDNFGVPISRPERGFSAWITGQGTATSSGQLGRTTTFAYDANGNLTSVTNPINRLGRDFSAWITKCDPTTASGNLSSFGCPYDWAGFSLQSEAAMKVWDDTGAFMVEAENFTLHATQRLGDRGGLSLTLN